jgi:hypothetical protein
LVYVISATVTVTTDEINDKVLHLIRYGDVDRPRRCESFVVIFVKEDIYKIQ